MWSRTCRCLGRCVEVGILGDPVPDRLLDLAGSNVVGERDTYRRYYAVVGRGTRFRLPQLEAVGAIERMLFALHGPFLGMDGRGPYYVVVRSHVQRCALGRLGGGGELARG